MKSIVSRPILAGALLASSLVITRAQPYTFGTLAGSANKPGNADGTNGAAQFTASTGLALDSTGQVIVVDGNSIRKITASGTNWVVSTLTGSILVHGFVDGTNRVAQFNDPQGVATDTAGNLYVADTDNNAIRKIAPVGTNWVVTTIAGPTPPSTTFGVADGTNNTARFNQPYGITVDNATNLYVADTLNNTIRKITPVGTNWVVTTLAGMAGSSGSANGSNGIARFSGPAGIAVDNLGSVYVTDFFNNTIRKLTQMGTNWAVTTPAGSPGLVGSTDGLGSAARFNLPQCIAVDGAQNLFVTDSANATIRKITPPGLVSTVAGLAGVIGTADGTGDSARFTQPYGIAVDGAGAIYVADYLGYAIRQGKLAPVLQYTISGKQLILSWPVGLTGYVAQVSATLANPSWGGLTNTQSISGEYWVVTNAVPTGAAFYRLHK